MLISVDSLKKALDAKKHPGIRAGSSLLSLARQGLPYLTSRAGNARPPITIYWNVNSVCNLRCKMCDVGTSNEESNFYKNLRIDRKLHEITLEKFCSVVDEVANYKPTMSINGTEPLMYKPLGEALAYAHKRGLDTSITTGAFTLVQRAEELAKSRLTRLNVSIDAAPELHNQIRGRTNVFGKATDGILAFKRFADAEGYKPEIFVNCTISNLNYDKLVEFFESVQHLPVDQFNFVNMNFVDAEMAMRHNLKWGKKYLATVNCLSEEVQPGKVDPAILHAQCEAVRQIGGDRVTFLPEFSAQDLVRYYRAPSEFMGSVPCMSSWFVAQVMADGDVIPYTRCYHVSLGNINEQPFLEVWNSTAAQAWRKDLRAEKRFPACSRCDLVY